MIYEIRTYGLKPGTVAEYEKRFADAIEVRTQYSQLYGIWHTEIGPLNQMVHIWAYEDLQHRADVRAAAAKDPSGKWPPHHPDLLLSQENDILMPIKGLKEWSGPQELGGVYELRMYTYPAGAIAQVHGKHGFGMKDGGYEYNFALIIMCAALILLGSGSLAADRFVWKRGK